mmetsp:Transcript_71661/g.167816  ORF Transcript_71661/g.167816 Transcript_71661/m.167816 type:complete len:209 (+) Transcript_71661:403-1029(+)
MHVVHRQSQGPPCRRHARHRDGKTFSRQVMHHVLKALPLFAYQVFPGYMHIFQGNEAGVTCMLTQFAEALGTAHTRHLRLNHKHGNSSGPPGRIGDTCYNGQLRHGATGDPHLPSVHNPPSLGRRRRTTGKLAQVTANFWLGHRHCNDSSTFQLRQPASSLLVRTALCEVRQDHIIAKVYEEASTSQIFDFLDHDTVVFPVKPTTPTC